MGKITYERNTTYSIGVTYVNTNGVPGLTAMFTAKTEQFDDDPTDTVNLLVKKDIALSLVAGVYTGSATINPTDIADTVDPDDYFYDVKVLDTSGAIYSIDSGDFVLNANPTNRET